MLPGPRLKATDSGSEVVTFVCIRLTNSWKTRKDLTCGQKTFGAKAGMLEKSFHLWFLSQERCLETSTRRCARRYVHILHLLWVTCVLIMLNYLPWFLTAVQKMCASIYPYIKHAGSWFIRFWCILMENHYQFKMLHWAYLQNGFCDSGPSLLTKYKALRENSQ